MDGVTVGAFEVVAVQPAIVFPVSDDRFDGVAPF